MKIFIMLNSTSNDDIYSYLATITIVGLFKENLSRGEL